MNKAKQKVLEKKGWKVGTVEEFLGLSPVESRYIELKLTLSKSGSGHILGTLDHTKMNRSDTFGLY
jgi:rRNA processing protein Gar1